MFILHTKESCTLGVINLGIIKGGLWDGRGFGTGMLEALFLLKHDCRDLRLQDAHNVVRTDNKSA